MRGKNLQKVISFDHFVCTAKCPFLLDITQIWGINLLGKKYMYTFLWGDVPLALSVTIIAFYTYYRYIVFQYFQYFSSPLFTPYTYAVSVSCMVTVTWQSVIKPNLMKSVKIYCVSTKDTWFDYWCSHNCSSFVPLVIIFQLICN